MNERRFGILIASSRFPDEPKLEDLRFPENDVDGLNELLVSQNQGHFTQTFVLKNKLHYEILLKINQVLREADKNDLVLIYYSGHGKLNPAGKLHLSSTDTVINALEATSIPVSTIKDYVDISSSNKIILILDCCFSGAAGLEFAKGGVDDQLNLISGGRGTYIMTASTGIQVAQEKESDQYGAFTKHVIEGIKSGEADLDRDGRITMGELYRYVHDHVLDEGFQEPMKWDLNVRGELVIAHSGKTPREERRKQIRDILFDLAKKGFLPNVVFDKARQVIALEPDQLSEEDRTYDKLLDELLGKRLELGEFIWQWGKVIPEKLQIYEAKKGKIFVHAIPENATVRILEINQPFQQGMELEPGSYHVEVAAKGYGTERQWIDLLAGHKERFRFELAKIKVAEPISPQKTITNSIGMKFVLIPAGSFTMGSRLSPEEVVRNYGGEAEYCKDEQPPHPVEITKPFYMQTTEVSQAQWKRVMGDDPSKFKDCGDDCPVEKVSWDDVEKFISKLNQMEGTTKYRLPTEAEWEYACRAGTTTVFSFGNEVDKLGEYAWYTDNSGSQTHPVGGKKPNDWGLYDMHGNVYEWCQDWYCDYPSSSVADPKGPDKGEYRVLRGGSWLSSARALRSASRYWYYPGYRDHYFYGFRVAQDF